MGKQSTEETGTQEKSAPAVKKHISGNGRVPLNSEVFDHDPLAECGSVRALSLQGKPLRLATVGVPLDLALDQARMVVESHTWPKGFRGVNIHTLIASFEKSEAYAFFKAKLEQKKPIEFLAVKIDKQKKNAIIEDDIFGTKPWQDCKVIPVPLLLLLCYAGPFLEPYARRGLFSSGVNITSPLALVDNKIVVARRSLEHKQPIIEFYDEKELTDLKRCKIPKLHIICCLNDYIPTK